MQVGHGKGKKGNFFPSVKHLNEEIYYISIFKYPRTCM